MKTGDTETLPVLMDQNNGLFCFYQYPIDINKYQLNHSTDMTNSALKGKLLQKLIPSIFTDIYFFFFLPNVWNFERFTTVHYILNVCRITSVGPY